jgi:hypothetical protein
MLAPMTGALDLSVRWPLMVVVWANAANEVKIKRQNSGKHFIMVVVFRRA